METITTMARLDEVLEQRNSAQPVGTFTRTRPKLKTGRSKGGVYPCPFVEAIQVDGKTKASPLVEHLSYRNHWIGSSRKAQVDNQLAREGKAADYEAKPLWNGHGSHLSKFLVTNNNENSDSFGRVYLAFQVTTRSDGETPKGVKSRYQWIDGDELTAAEMDDLREWFPTSSSTKESTGADIELFWRTIDLSNIEFLRVNGTDYLIDIPPTAINGEAA